MDQILDLASTIAKQVVGSTARINRVAGGRVNSVFRVSDAAQKSLVALRLFQHPGYPSIDSLLHVDHQLEQLGVGRARVIAYDRGNPDVPNGWMAIDWLRGTRCDVALRRAYLSPAQFATQLGAILSVTHSQVYGLFGPLPNGTHPRASDYLWDLLERSPIPARLSTSATHQLDSIRQRTATLSDTAAVLTHGDVTLTNAIWSKGQVTLFDWDNAAAAPSARDARGLVRELGVAATGAFKAAHGRCCDRGFDPAMHEMFVLIDVLRAACAVQSTERDRTRVEQQIRRTNSALRQVGG